MGLPGHAVQVDFEKIAYKELRVSGGLGQRRPAWRRAIALLGRGAIDPTPLITHELSLSEWQRAFEIAERREGLKVMLRPD